MEQKLNETNDELTASNIELQAYIEEMVASEEELRNQYDQIVEFDKKLSASEEKYKGLITQMQLGIALYEGNGSDDITNYKLTDVNNCHEVLTGFKNSEILGKYFYQIHVNFEPSHLDNLNHTLRTGEPTRYERYQKTTDKYYEIIAYRPKLNQVAVIVNDVTQRRLAEEKVRISENNFRSVFEYSADTIFLLDQSTVINCNSAAVTLLGYDSRESIIGKTPLEFSPEIQPDGKLSSEYILENINYCNKYGKHKFEWWHQKLDGTLIPSEIVMTTIRSNDKNIFHAMCRDISDRKQMEEKLQFLSYHDQLTGLYNRRFFEEELIRLDQENYYPLTITMADINGLKLINDSFGHATGDEYIKKVANVLLLGAGVTDVVCRLSGDEFIIMSPNKTVDQVKKMVDKIKELSSNEKVRSVNISVSFGYSSKDSAEDSMIEVLKKAEDFMYKKKLFESPSMRGKTISTIITTLHEKNPREEQHSHRVSQLCEKMGRVLEMQEDEIRELKTVGLLHDIGKVAVDEGILNKNGKLTAEEMEEIRKHPEIGYRILSTVNELAEMAEYVLAHHERWDGLGYPKGLRGEEIPKQSSIIAIADAYDAMISERSYRKALTKEYAVSELLKGAGTQFNAEYVQVFVEKVIDSPLL
jgi:diguanylate cyclase (GGDEF)-like protein/PAS domain S-box-containing protein/putative nucleotidyltransferase with HDIG domain